MSDLRTGAAMLKEVLQRETEKAERDLQNKQQEKAAAEAAKLKVRQFFAVKPSARVMC